MSPLREEIERIREVRRQISTECGDNPRRLVHYYRRIAAQLRATGRYKFVEPATPKPEAEATLREEPPASE